MNTFEQKYVTDKGFSYTRGAITTLSPWSRPSYDKVYAFLDDVSKTSEIFELYDSYLLGGVLWDFTNTWDVDMMLLGDYESYEKLEEQMHYLYDKALNEYSLLIDIVWSNSIQPDLSYEDLVESSFMKEDSEHVAIGYAKKCIGEDCTVVDLRDDAQNDKYGEYLVRKYNKTRRHSDKFIARIQNTAGIARTTFPVSEFLANDEQYFLKNTNRNETI